MRSAGLYIWGQVRLDRVKLTRRIYEDFLEDTSPTAKVLSLAIAAAYITLAYKYGQGLAALKLSFKLIWPLTFIWGAEYLQSYHGWAGTRLIMSDTPAIIIRIGGWSFLLLPVALWLLGCEMLPAKKY